MKKMQNRYNVNRNYGPIMLMTLIAFMVLCVLILTTLLNTSEVPKQHRYGIVTIFSKNHLCEAIHSCRTYANIPEIRKGKVTVIALYAPDVKPDTLIVYHEKCPVVKLQPFNVDKYPSYFKNYKNYRFKFPTVISLLPQFSTLMFFDASIRLQLSKNETLTDLFLSMETKFASQGIRMLSQTYHSNFVVTHPEMYSFFNVTEKQTKVTKQLQSGLYLLNNSPAGWNFINKVVDCAIEPNCMSPNGANVHCNLKALKSNNRVVCHRFDQSAINLRLIEMFGVNASLYYEPSSIIGIKRIGNCKV